ncbi:uncharacterized protein LOC104308126 [Dryobates pubescens]|uniref:uncharacterized protein LOC104308126 n=1 Tax=Dryobates pubescens TaxID=118200 RepID=UPI0023B9CF6C|nr:uncharacterized protein LOC104308126 [Dryobates pubescens]
MRNRASRPPSTPLSRHRDPPAASLPWHPSSCTPQTLPRLSLLAPRTFLVPPGLHSLRYFHISLAEPSLGLPQFTAVGYVDGVPIARYDSNSRRMEPLREWMKANLEQGYWDGQTHTEQINERMNEVNLVIVQARYNQSGSEWGWEGVRSASLEMPFPPGRAGSACQGAWLAERFRLLLVDGRLSGRGSPAVGVAAPQWAGRGGARELADRTPVTAHRTPDTAHRTPPVVPALCRVTLRSHSQVSLRDQSHQRHGVSVGSRLGFAPGGPRRSRERSGVIASIAMGSRWVLGLGLFLGVLGGAVNGLHSLRYFHISLAEPSWGLPQFTAVGYVDGVPIARYDSNSRRMEPLREWMKANLDQGYWDGQTHLEQINERMNEVNIDILQTRYNQSGRPQTLQQIHGCDLLEDGSTRGYYQSAIDGRDFLALNEDMKTFTAADQAAVLTKRKWEEDGTVAEHWKHYLEKTCVEWLKRYLSYGQAELERREPPVVRVSGKESQGILSLSCRLYGFYPRPIGVSWLKGAEVRDQDTQRGSIVPNSDGSFSTWASIEVLPQEQELYRCRVEHSSLPQPRLYSWEPEGRSLPVVLAVVAAVVTVVATVGMGIAVWKWRSGESLGGEEAEGGKIRRKASTRYHQLAGVLLQRGRLVAVLAAAYKITACETECV